MFKQFLSYNNRRRLFSTFKFSSQIQKEIQLLPSSSSSSNLKSDVLIIPFKTGKKQDLLNSIPIELSNEYKNIINNLINDESFTASESEKLIVRLPNNSNEGSKFLALVGLDEQQSDFSFGRTISSVAKQIKAKKVNTVMFDNFSTSKIFNGIYEENYNDKRYKSKVGKKNNDNDNKEWDGIESLSFVNISNPSLNESYQEVAQTSSKIARGVTFARELVGAPPNSKTPIVLGHIATKISQDYPNFTCTVLGQSECEARNMGGYLAVQQGSKYPPQFIHLTYKSPSSTSDSNDNKIHKVALVGKGLTFDSGGYNLKVGASSSIELMKFDMGGCAAVLGCAKAIAELQPKNLEVHFIVAACENMISSEAMKPGDIVTASNGKTIEILNTDAEGRLTLADALVYSDNLNVDSIIDLATLTGACVVALGEECSGLYSNSEILCHQLKEASLKSGDELWHMPLNKKYIKNIKSKIADIKNIGEHGGGSITAALFLQEFVRDTTKWAHIDMAGPVWDSRSHNPTGYGVKLLIEYLLSLK